MAKNANNIEGNDNTTQRGLFNVSLRRIVTTNRLELTEDDLAKVQAAMLQALAAQGITAAALTAHAAAVESTVDAAMQAHVRQCQEKLAARHADEASCRAELTDVVRNMADVVPDMVQVINELLHQSGQILREQREGFASVQDTLRSDRAAQKANIQKIELDILNLVGKPNQDSVTRENIQSKCQSLIQMDADNVMARFFAATYAKHSLFCSELSAISERASKQPLDYRRAMALWLVKAVTPKTAAACKGFVSVILDVNEEQAHFVHLLDEEIKRLDAGVYNVNQPRDVFVAHSAADAAFVENLVADIEGQGITCFYSERNIRQGTGGEGSSFRETWMTAMRHCRLVLFVLSEHSAKEGCEAWNFELPYATEDCKLPVVTYALISVNTLPAIKRQYFSKFADQGKGIMACTTRESLDKTLGDVLGEQRSKGIAAFHASVMAKNAEEQAAAEAKQRAEAEAAALRKQTEEEIAAIKRQAAEDVAAIKRQAAEETAAARKKAEEEAAAARKKAEEQAAAAKKIAEEAEAAARKKAAEAADGSAGLQYSLLDDGTYQVSGYKGSATQIAIPRQYNGKAVTAIKNSTFYNCAKLTSVSIPDSVTVIGNSAFYGCSAIQAITIPSKVTTIGQNAFDSCSGLQAITIPNSVKTIGSGAFKGCRGLTSVTIPNDNQLTSIGGDAFADCIGLRTITAPTWSAARVARQCGSTAFRVVITSGTEIKDDAFEDCYGLTDITIPASVKKISEMAFSACYRLVEIYNKSAVEIGSAEASNIYQVTGDSMLSMGEDGFLRYIDGATVSLVAYYGKATDLTIPLDITEIKEYAFYNCSGLTSVTIPEGVTVIGMNAFYDCSALTSITIPESVTAIGEGAFYDCTGLVEIVYKGTKRQWRAIDKYKYWDKQTGKYLVKCTDGTIRKGLFS